MVSISYHASHEQFSPGRLLELVQRAERAGFDAAKSSDHFHPWSERQGQSGFAWSWLGAAMQATSFPIGMISAPGYRYHPAVLAQAAATIGEMFPDRLWLALGSGEAINESITGEVWPDKPERNARLRECVDVTRRLFAGETVTHRGRITVVEARLYSRPARPVPLFGAAVTPATARLAAGWADGLLITGSTAKSVAPLIEAFRSAGGTGPIHLQSSLCYAATLAEAERQAVEQWASATIGGEAMWDLRRPSDFDTVASSVTADDLRQGVVITDSPSAVAEWIEQLAQLDLAAIHLHQVGTNQDEFIDMMREELLPRRLSAAG